MPETNTTALERARETWQKILGVSCIEHHHTAHGRAERMSGIIAAAILAAQREAYESLYYPTELYPDGPPFCCNGDECECYGKPIEPPAIWSVGDPERRLYKLVEARITDLTKAEEELKS